MEEGRKPFLWRELWCVRKSAPVTREIRGGCPAPSRDRVPRRCRGGALRTCGVRVWGADVRSVGVWGVGVWG